MKMGGGGGVPYLKEIRYTFRTFKLKHSSVTNFIMLQSRSSTLFIGLSYERPYLVLALNLILFFVYAVRIP